MSDYIKIGKYHINREHIASYRFLCDSKKCLRIDKCCCKLFEAAVSREEMERIISIMDVIAGFCRNLKNGDSYKNVFLEEKEEFVIEARKDGYCVFAYFDKKNRLKCGIHSAAVELGIDPLYYKPRPCWLWPFTLERTPGKKVFIDLYLQEPFPCLVKKRTPDNTIDPGLQEILITLIGKEKLNRLVEMIKVN